MTAATLFSGSSGNSFLFRDDSTAFLIDAGVSSKKLSCALASFGLSFADISAVFVTHEHVDHIKGLETISKHYGIPVYIKEKSARSFIHEENMQNFQNLFVFPSDFSVNIGNIRIHSFKTPHDSSDSCGYIIETQGKKIGYATDCGTVTPLLKEQLRGCDAVVLEANHDVERLKNGPYPYLLKKRILSDSGHLSNENSARFAQELCQYGTKSFVFAHLSKENNTPELVLKTVSQYLPEEVTVRIASPDAPTILKI